MTAVAMRLIVWVPIFMSVLANPTMAQAECDTDANCMSNQYCFGQSHLCVNYTVCSRYNREENGTPAREPGQCGICLKGYSFEGRTLESTGAEDSCVKDMNAQNYNPERSTSGISGWVIGCASVFVSIILFVISWALWNRKFFCQDRSGADPSEMPANSLLMVEKGVRASAPPAPSPTQSRNNNNYYDAEESNPLSRTRDYLRSPMVDISHPVKAQGYHPPDYVRVDLSYNPGEDTQTTVQTTFSPPDIDEETIPSGWSPGPSSGGAVPLQPFAAITEEVQDNATNTALQRYTCPPPSTSQENHGDRENNSSNGNSGGFNYNNTNGTPRGNSNPVRFVQVNQTVNFINQGSNGR